MDQPIITIGQLSLVGIFLFLISIWVNHLLANTRDAKNKRAEQGRKVIDAFSAELEMLIHTWDDARLILTPIALRKHESAIRNFLPYLPWVTRLRMRRAWRKLAYRKKDKKAQMPFYEQYAECGSLDKRSKMRPIAIARIQKIISLATK